MKESLLFILLLAFPIILLATLLTPTGEPLPFERGDVIHHRADDTPGVVLSCEDSFCRVSTSRDTLVWYSSVIRELND